MFSVTITESCILILIAASKPCQHVCQRQKSFGITRNNDAIGIVGDLYLAYHLREISHGYAPRQIQGHSSHFPAQ